MESNTDPNYDKPVAYDNEGRPLYARPPDIAHQTAQAQIVHVARATDPEHLPISDETKRRHDESVAKYPTLNISNGEFIISAVRRHWIGLLLPVFFGGILALLVVAGLASYPVLVPGGNPPFESLILPAILMLVLIGLGVYIVVWVYLNNKFFLTNESVIQEIQTSLFAHNEQTVSLLNIEDASYTQTGILQLLLNYGSIRLSTEGDETTYRFQFVSNPKQQIALLNNAVEAFKNGRPVLND
jgi:hypothetical protein